MFKTKTYSLKEGCPRCHRPQHRGEYDHLREPHLPDRQQVFQLVRAHPRRHLYHLVQHARFPRNELDQHRTQHRSASKWGKLIPPHVRLHALHRRRRRPELFNTRIGIRNHPSRIVELSKPVFPRSRAGLPIVSAYRCHRGGCGGRRSCPVRTASPTVLSPQTALSRIRTSPIHKLVKEASGFSPYYDTHGRRLQSARDRPCTARNTSSCGECSDCAR